MRLSPSIFKAYDIRGVVPSTLDETVARALGRAFGTKALAQGQSVVAVGRDGRLSGPALSQALIEGLSQAGVAVIDVGAVTTPMLYFASARIQRSENDGGWRADLWRGDSIFISIGLCSSGDGW